MRQTGPKKIAPSSSNDGKCHRMTHINIFTPMKQNTDKGDACQKGPSFNHSVHRAVQTAPYAPSRVSIVY